MVDEKKADPGEKKDAEVKAEAAGAKAKASNLAPAGESSNPEVHQALAELDIALRNRDSLDVPEEDKKAADDAVKAAEKKLKDLGVSP